VNLSRKLGWLDGHRDGMECYVVSVFIGDFLRSVLVMLLLCKQVDVFRD